jgi:UDP-N-acetylmuramyl-tripeptide synthetase
MGSVVEEAIGTAIRALLNRDEALAHKVIDADERVNSLELEIDHAILDLLALQQPVASDLRFILASQKINNDLGFQVFVDYAHTDQAMRSLMETIRDLKPHRLLLVFGAGGDRDKTKRPRMGEVAASFADMSFITSDNPRSEDPLAIIADIEKGFSAKGAKNYKIIPDRREAIGQALAAARKGDYVLIAGKGHETYQIFKDKTIHFDDVEVVRSALKDLEAKP